MSCLLPSLSLIFFWTLSPLPISPFCSPPCLHLSPFPPSTILSLCLYLCPPTLPLPFPPSLPIYMYLLLLPPPPPPPPPHSLPLSPGWIAYGTYAITQQPDCINALVYLMLMYFYLFVFLGASVVAVIWKLYDLRTGGKQAFKVNIPS